MLDTVIGPKSDIAAIDRLLELLGALPLSGTAYVGYPLVVLPKGPAAVDLLLTCREHGVVVFDICRGAARLPETSVSRRQQDLRDAVAIALERSGRVTVAKRLIVEIRVLTLDPEAPSDQVPPDPPAAIPAQPHAPPSRWGGPHYSSRPAPQAPAHGASTGPLPRSSTANARTKFKSGAFANWTNVVDLLRNAPPLDAASLRYVSAAVQRIGGVRPVPSKPRLGALAGPRAEALAAMDKKIANLDRWQKAAAIEMPEGPQRIRGLAGTGKTIVLALKAAYLHAREPKWRIVLTFYGRTLYETLREMVRRFYREHTQREPDWDRLRIQHAWGARERAGVYSEVAAHLGLSPVGVPEAMRQLGRSRVFERVCLEVLAAMGADDPQPIYDAVLIDEAQDLPAAFLEMVFRVATPPKRIVWAYDDLQQLDDYEPTSPSRLFGSDVTGRPRVPTLAHVEGDARRDIILPVCYRNTPWALTTAHALGLGVYRAPVGRNSGTGLVQFYDDPELWKEIGYVVENGGFVPGKHVTLVRDPHCTPEFFEELIKPEDALQCFAFPDEASEAEWVAAEISNNLERDGLAARDILIVSANPYFKKNDGIPLIKALTRRRVPVHIAGSDGRVDELFGTGSSVPISNIKRAKGSEAAMVYVVHAAHCARHDNIVRRRNTLFSAITRSRAWVRITGSGEEMQIVKSEVDRVVAAGYRLGLAVPTGSELARLRMLQRDVTSSVRRPRRTRSS